MNAEKSYYTILASQNLCGKSKEKKRQNKAKHSKGQTPIFQHFKITKPFT